MEEYDNFPDFLEIPSITGCTGITPNYLAVFHPNLWKAHRDKSQMVAGIKICLKR
jgi:hypothetical protein